MQVLVLLKQGGVWYLTTTIAPVRLLPSGLHQPCYHSSGGVYLLYALPPQSTM